MNQLQGTLSHIWNQIQGFLFPLIENEVGQLNDKQRQLISILEMVRVEDRIKVWFGPGRPADDRKPIARAFVAKAVYNFSTTRQLLDRLANDPALRKICGWVYRESIPSESSFSRAFAEFSALELPSKVHEALIKSAMGSQLVGHVSRDATEIEAREKPESKKVSEAPTKIIFPRGRPKKDENRPPAEPTKLERQANQTLPEMLAELPRNCDVGTKRNSKGYKESWIGYKLHLDASDGKIPLACILTSASPHDSQVALPLSLMTSSRVTSLYDLMDSAYDSEIIRGQSRRLGHVPIIDSNPRRGEKVEFDPAKKERYKERTNVERVFSRLKDEFGGRTIRVRGNAKVFAHLMFGILALTADQLMRLIV
jgi:transposase